MKIITDFKDYYDYGMAFGIDEGIIYERFQKTIHPPEHIEMKQGGVLGFCDEFWQVEKIGIADEKSKSWRNRFRGEIFTYEDRTKKLIENGWFEGSPVYDSYDKHEITDYYWLRPIININTESWHQNSWRNYDFTHWNNWLASVFMEHEVPSFYVGHVKSFETTLNPVLVDYGLQKVMDPVQAFQKLSTFIPSLKQIDDIVMTDEEKGRSKGFDEYSFRHKNTKNKPKKF